MRVADPVAQDVTSPLDGTVTAVSVAVGDAVAVDAAVAFVEAMKMEHRVGAPVGGTVTEVLVGVGDRVGAGSVLVRVAPGGSDAGAGDDGDEPVSIAPREDLLRLRRRRALLEDDARPEAVRARHEAGRRTARENVAALLDDGSFSELGGLAIAAQRRRRDVGELQRRTPADGLVTGTGTVNADLYGPEHTQVAVAAYDYTVLAGTQGWTNHRKKDRLFELAHRLRLPTVVFAEGGGGRPGDTDNLGASWLDAEAFSLFARLSGRVPTVAIVDGYCFAGNAALAGCADVIIATETANLGMAGPAMIAGGGLGDVAPDEIGPTEVQRANGVVDIVVADDVAAVEVARRYLGYTQGRAGSWSAADQAALRDAVPQNRKRVYDVRSLIGTLADDDSVLELRRDFAPGMVTAFARIEGRPVGLLANDPEHLGGAIDADGADAAARLLRLCDAYGLPVLVLCDTPGFMVGPEAERDGGVRHFSRMFLAGASLRVPIVCVITRKAYGLGAQAMMGGHLRVPVLTVGWPTSELGPMGLEGAVRLGFRRELEAVDDEAERAAREREMIAAAHARAGGLNVASFGDIDDVIDPAETRRRVVQALDGWRPEAGGPPDRFIDAW